jgi:8-oxo-dGTP diphosphatase
MPQPAKRTRLSAYGLATRAEEILLVKISPRNPSAGKWTLPGGGVNWGETLEEGLHREFMEETGLTCLMGDWAFEIGFHAIGKDGKGLFVHQIVFEVEASSGVPEVIEVDGSTERVEWVPIARATDLPLVRIAKLALDRVRQARL